MNVLQHEHSLAGFVLLLADVRAEVASQSRSEAFVIFLHLGKIAKQLADSNVAALFGGFRIKTLSLELHRFGFFADSI